MSQLVSDLRAAIGRENVLSAPSELVVYDCDAFTIERRRPDAVVLPTSTQQVADAVKLCRQHGAALIPRGAGTSLAGGCLPLSGGVVLMLSRMNRVEKIDLRNRMAVVEAGVPNLKLAQALAGTGYHFAPDPSSQNSSTIGGNVATNAGGPHTLKYGVTVNHVLGLEAVLADGSIIQLGPIDNPGSLDLIGLLVGSEGTLAVVTKVWVRLTPNPQDYRAMRAIFQSVDDAGNAVSQIIAAGIIPAAMELMDQGILAAVEEAYHFGFPPDAGAVLVIEVDGPAIGLDRQQEQIVEFCRRFGAREVLQASSAQERELLWKCRKMSVGATGRLSPSYTIQDGVVPRTRLPQIIRRTAEIGQKHQIRIVNVAHAGDGNIHPILLFDERNREEVERALAAGREILEECIACGGSITAEHGIGVEKIGLMERLFTPADLAAMRQVRHAFDPDERLNPGKLIPSKKTDIEECPDSCGRRRAAIADENETVAIGTRVIDYPSDDMTITVEAGLTVAELAKTLAVKRQRLPVDVSHPDRTTIGDAVAVNAAGPRRYGYGTMRDYLLGFTAVDGLGNVFSGGGRVVKNAAGYNLCRLMAGSHGTLGVLKQLTLMVRPQPEASVLFVCDVPNFDTAEALLGGLIRSPVRPVAVEFVAGRIPKSDVVLGPMLLGNVGRFYVGFEGPADEVDWMTGQLCAQWTAAGASEPMVVPTNRAQSIWRWLTDFPAELQINVLPDAAIRIIAEILKRYPEIAIDAHAGDGIIRLAMPTGSEYPTKIASLREIAAAAGGRLTVCQTPEDIAFSRAEIWGPPGPEMRLMQALKDRFDPNGVLNPGAFVFD